MSDDHVLDVNTYSDQYVSPELEQGQEAYDLAWSDLLEGTRHLYFHTHPALDNHDVADARRYFCTPQELARAAEIIEQRTVESLKRQKCLLVAWNAGATGFQRIFRGFAARKRFVILLLARSKDRIGRFFAIKFALLRIRRRMTARLIQRRFRLYLSIRRRYENALAVLERSSQLFVFRRRRLHARNRISRWQKRIFYRRKLLRAVHRLFRIAREAQKRALAQQAAEYFRDSQEFRRELKELAYFSQKKDTYVLHRRVKVRKVELYHRKFRKKNKVYTY